jgi:hypothetical protein
VGTFYTVTQMERCNPSENMYVPSAFLASLHTLLASILILCRIETRIVCAYLILEELVATKCHRIASEMVSPSLALNVTHAI